MTSAGGAPVWGAARLGAPSALPATADVVVVGGGITGTALLGELLDRGADAILLERGHIACGASGRNAGFLLAGVAENYARAAARYGREVAAEVWGFTTVNHELIAALAAPMAAGHARPGSLTVATGREEAASLEEAATMLAEDGFPAELRAEGLPPGGLLGLFNPRDGEIDPAAVVRGLALRHGGRVHEETEVTAVEDGDRGVTVRLSTGSIEAASAVLATNAWTTELLPGVPIRPVRAQMLATAPAVRRLPVPTYAHWGHRYWRQREDGVVLVGGFRDRAVDEEVGVDALPTERIQRHLDAQLRELGILAPVTHRWAGIMGFSEDGLPLAGRPPGARHLLVCGGYTGHGLGFAVHAARALAAHLLDSEALPRWLAAGRPGSVSPSPSAPERTPAG